MNRNPVLQAMARILDKTGHIPLDGDDVCFAKAECGN